MEIANPLSNLMILLVQYVLQTISGPMLIPYSRNNLVPCPPLELWLILDRHIKLLKSVMFFFKKNHPATCLVYHAFYMKLNRYRCLDSVKCLSRRLYIFNCPQFVTSQGNIYSSLSWLCRNLSASSQLLWPMPLSWQSSTIVIFLIWKNA
jgi:hypothetical protein